MTNKNDSVKQVRIRNCQQKLDSLKPTARRPLNEIGTLEGGVIIIQKVPAPERRPK